MVMVLAAVIAVAVAIPALAAGGGATRSGSVRGLSKRALAKAKLALRTSRGAKRSARAAASAATLAQVAAAGAKAAAAEALVKAAGAREVAGGAELKAGEAREAFASTHVKVDVAEGARATGSESFVKLAEGPSLTVAVTGSGLVQVWAQAEVSDGGAVSLFEDGQPVAAQADCFGEPAGAEEEDGVLFASPSGAEGGAGPLTLATPASLPLCSALGPPGPVLFQSTAGQHSFELRYAACGCASGAATFSGRRLIVQPLP
jgi:hypothetical protein